MNSLPQKRIGDISGMAVLEAHLFLSFAAEVVADLRNRMCNLPLAARLLNHSCVDEPSVYQLCSKTCKAAGQKT